MTGSGDNFIGHIGAGQVQDELSGLPNLLKRVSLFSRRAANTRSSGRKTGMMQDQGAIFRTPLRLIVDIKVTGSGMKPSRINGLKIKVLSYLGLSI